MDSLEDKDRSPEVPEEISQPEEIEEQHGPAPSEEPTSVASGTPAHRASAEQALAAMRADLREEESKELAGGRGLRGLIQRLFRRRRAPPPEEAETPSRLDELQFPEPPPARISPKPPAEEAPAPTEPQTPQPSAAEGKPDFQAMVRDRLTEAWTATVQREPLEMEPPAPVEEEEPHPGHSILTTLRQEPGEVAEEPVEPVDFRQAALEDYVVASEEPEEEPGTPVVRRLKTSWRYMRPTEKRLLIGALLIIALAMVAGSGYLAFQSIPMPTAVVTPTIPANPIPISVSLPGGWVFPLNVGYVAEGQWNPKTAEWLSDTEVCRWVSLPWTVQLEAVVRTLKANDEIELSMSTYDKVAYKVKSIQQVPSSGIKKLCPESPSMLLILSKEGTDDRWVVTAQP